MGLLRRIAGFLGFSKDDAHEVKDEDDDEHHHEGANTASEARNRVHMKETSLPRKGFSVPVQVAVDRAHSGPVLVSCNSGDGGVQGLRWYAKRLRVDEDGDVADEFYDEIALAAPSNSENDRKPFPRFQVKYNTRPARVKRQAILQGGRIQQCVEHQGRLQWV